MLSIRRFEELAAQVEPTARPVADPGPDVRALPRREVRFAGVSFTYPGTDRPVLDRLDLRLPAGLCTAVVGVNGAGKTTLVKLLTRLHEPTAGAVEVDGVDLRSLGVDAWRRQVSVIFQDFVRYQLPAADNIALGAVAAPPADRELVRRAAEDAGILEALETLPRGLDTPAVAQLPRRRRPVRRAVAAGRDRPLAVRPARPARPCWSWTNRPRRWTSGPRRSSSTSSSS